MKALTIVLFMFVSACSVTPKIIQDERVPCKNEPNVQVNTGSNLGWILWYVTMACVVVYWWKKENKKEEIENE